MRLTSLTGIALALLPLAATAKPRVVISIAQAKEVALVTGGTRSTRMVPTQSASPGDVVEYALSYTNQGDEPATNAVIDDPIPKGTTYIANSAAGEDAEITFSSDGGKNYAQPVKLTYQIKLPSGAMEQRIATPAEYTHIRWTIKEVRPGAAGKVSFRVKVN